MAEPTTFPEEHVQEPLVYRRLSILAIVSCVLAVLYGAFLLLEAFFVYRGHVPFLSLNAFLQAIPVLAVEVLSPLSNTREMTRKIEQYQEAGVELIWIVDPMKCEVDVYSALPLKTLRKGDALSDEKILPGISIPVASLFEPVL